MPIPNMKYFLLRKTSLFYFASLLDLFIFYLDQKRLYRDYASGVIVIGEVVNFETGDFKTIYSPECGGCEDHV